MYSFIYKQIRACRKTVVENKIVSFAQKFSLQFLENTHN